VTTQPPLLDFHAPEVKDGDAGALTAKAPHEGQRFAGLDLSALDLTDSAFLECELDGLSLGETQLRGSRLVESLLSASFAPVLLASRTTWRDVRVERPRWGSAELYDSELGAVHVVGGKIDYLNLRDSRLTNVLLEGCTIGELDLRRARLERVSLRDCTIGSMELDRASAKDVDIRSSQFSVVNGLDGLRGVTIDDLQLSLLAPLLAQHLGIVVE
jgi:uncharacterized protein YjbI with pentapeptide repeats